MKTVLSTVTRNYRPWLSVRHSLVCSAAKRSYAFAGPSELRPCAPRLPPAVSVIKRYNSATSEADERARSLADQTANEVRPAEDPSNSSTTSEADEPARPLTDRLDGAHDEQSKADIEARKAEQPSYQLTFTCAKCLDRSSHRISKQAYHHGTVLVNCPSCKNKHLISDHLGIFSDRGVTLEDIMKEKGEKLKKGVLGADGDVEFY